MLNFLKPCKKTRGFSLLSCKNSFKFAYKEKKATFLAYEGNYESDKKSKIAKTSQKIETPAVFMSKNSPSFSQKCSVLKEIRGFLDYPYNNLTKEGAHFLESIFKETNSKETLIIEIFMLSYLIDPQKKLYSYPSLFTRNFEYFKPKCEFLQYISEKTRDFLARILYEKIMSLRYFSDIKITVDYFLYILYSLQVSQYPQEISQVLDKDLFITLVNSLDLGINPKDLFKINVKETLFLLKACNSSCFFDIEPKMQNFNPILLTIVENKVDLMGLLEISAVLKELRQIPILSHFPTKKFFCGLIEKIQNRLLVKLTAKTVIFDKYEKLLLKTPHFYQWCFLVFSKFAVISQPALQSLETSFLKNVEDFISNIEAFIAMTKFGAGEKILQIIKEKLKNEETLEILQNPKRIYLVSKLLLKIVILEMTRLWNSLQKTEKNDSLLIYNKSLIAAKEKIKPFLASNLEIIEKTLEICVKAKAFKTPKDRERFSRIIEFLIDTERLELLKLSEKTRVEMNLLINDVKNENLAGINKNESNHYNQFNADICSILLKNQVPYSVEQRIGYHYCDILLTNTNIVLELDGKYHFYTNKKEEELVSNKCRNLYVIMKKLRLFEINIFQWEKIREDDKMESVLMKKLSFFLRNNDIIFMK